MSYLNASALKLIITLSVLFLSSTAFSQIGIGTTTPHASASLEVKSTSKGFLPPRIALTSISDVSTISSPATGLLIFNTATTGTTPNNVTPGYYYWNATNWVRLEDNSLSKITALVGRGTDVTLGNLKVRIASSGNASLQVSTVSGTYSVSGSSIHAAGGTGNVTISGSSPLSITTTPTYLYSTLSFNGAGYRDEWLIYDASGSIAWRISMIIGNNYLNNLISIERIL